MQNIAPKTLCDLIFDKHVELLNIQMENYTGILSYNAR